MKVFLYMTTLCLCLFIGGCKQEKQPEATTVDILKQASYTIQSCAELNTTEYRLHKIITLNDEKRLQGHILGQDINLKLPVGERKIAVPMDVTLYATIDFRQFSRQQIRKEGDRLIVTLPEPQIKWVASKINHADIKEYVTGLRADFSDKELTNITRQGEEAVRKDIPNLGLLERAREDATALIVPILTRMGYKEENIEVVFPKTYSPQNLPLKRIIEIRNTPGKD